MKGKSNYNLVDYSYVFSAKKKLELEHGKKGTVVFGKMKNKWAVAAAVALASGSVVLFAPNGKVQAAEVDPNVKTEQVETKQAEQGQSKNDAVVEDDKTATAPEKKAAPVENNAQKAQPKQAIKSADDDETDD
ncbi:hypothetical protein [Lactobacillus kefiranofaciens]|uniref:Uncharacterized protein n=1 Tax=Lactobacillus kefiranofaciens TaxID=267818 RepID=A0AAX3UGI0_9LACO|nr:hypothetical protein [Lactobacillus kefiranofaciens]AEG39871.1 hypothetical protein WANG_0176 [Lactobacillus kefiranofaciens subsp. kefiranofaciens]KRM21933.1 hypothetical protein FC93_GL002305 [Lactobacillus kefiranofaciens subsp. kefiranofaciens DSM 5016 = JCM 6985]QFQ67477.1 hypothetical protein LKK75_02965 [Lactobacillus kefiranofaciens subsp. kefiranofaciens]WGO86783.1 hypothetical protein QEJ78_04945 [Lactobacillus kefiranofaciens]WQH35900.1 hypothetical protein U2870_10495 [Lactobaci